MSGRRRFTSVAADSIVCRAEEYFEDVKTKEKQNSNIRNTFSHLLLRRKYVAKDSSSVNDTAGLESNKRALTLPSFSENTIDQQETDPYAINEITKSLKPTSSLLLFKSVPALNSLIDSEEVRKRQERVNENLKLKYFQNACTHLTHNLEFPIMERSIYSVSTRCIREKNRNHMIASLKKYKKYGIAEVDKHFTKALVNYQRYLVDPVLATWNFQREENVCLKDFQLCRPAKFVRGGQGHIFAVYNRTTRLDYAMKLKIRDLSKSKNAWCIELREHEILKNAHHKFIVSLYHTFQTKCALIMIMELLEGGCLWSHVAYNGLFTEDVVVYISACMLNALEFLHQLHVIFRDMKAENVVLDWRGRPKLIDFGMAKYLKKRESYESSNGPIDTQYYYAGYIAPEVYIAEEPLTEKVDVWGIGYLITEIQLGYGIFLSMPWETLPKKHLGAGWKLNLVFPNGVDCVASKNCQHFLHQTMLQQPSQRPSIRQLKTFHFFRTICWDQLQFMPGINVFDIQYRKITRCGNNQNTASGINGVTLTKRVVPNANPKMRRISSHRDSASIIINASTKISSRKSTSIRQSLTNKIWNRKEKLESI